MFDIKANNVKVDDKLIDTQNRVWTVVAVDDSEQPCYCFSEEAGHALWFYGNGFGNIGKEYEIVGFAPGYGNQATANKPHKHKDLIIAWANGAEIEYFHPLDNKWHSTSAPEWFESTEYRIKPEPKPDVIKYVFVEEKPSFCNIFNDNNLKLTFCGETGKLKAAEVIN